MVVTILCYDDGMEQYFGDMTEASWDDDVTMMAWNRIFGTWL